MFNFYPYFCLGIDIYEKLNNMDKIDKVIKEAIDKVINEEIGVYREQLVEMALINTDETNKNIFPHNKFEVRVWSNDHEPPHFHILCDGWNLLFGIDDGRLIRTKSEGKNPKIGKYIIDNVEKWLESPCVILPAITNRQNARAMWIQMHPKR